MFRKSFFVVLISLLSSVLSGQAEAKEYSLLRADQTHLTYYVDAPNSEKFPIAVFIQGSECRTSFTAHERTKGAFLGMGVGVLTIEKRGLDQSSTTCPREYLEHNTVNDRVLDYVMVISELRKTLSSWNRKLILASGSEGAVVATLLAPLLPETRLLVVMALGGGLSTADDMLLLTQKGMAASGATQTEIDHATAEMKAQFKAMSEDPTPWKEWLSDGEFARNTYKWWNAILPIKPLTVLEKLDIPIYMAQGTADVSVPVESADLVAKRFNELGKTNFTYKRYEGLGHSWTDQSGQSHVDRVLQDAFTWIASHLED